MSARRTSAAMLGLVAALDCDAYWRCYLACPTPDCKFSCALEHEAGVSLFRAVQSDYAAACSGACQYGNYWASAWGTSAGLPRCPRSSR